MDGLIMSISNIHEAKSRLSRLVEQAERGEEVIIARAGKPVAKLVPYHESEKARQGGQWRGKIRIAKDFDELPENIAIAFGVSTIKRRKNK
jgi:prevent-host-death family protein